MSSKHSSETLSNNAHVKDEPLDESLMTSKQQPLSLIYRDETATDDEKLKILNDLIEHEDPNNVNWQCHTERAKLLYRLGKYNECSSEISRCRVMPDLPDDLSIISIKCSIRIEVHNGRQNLVKMINKNECKEQDEWIEFLNRLSNNNIDKLLGDEQRPKSNSSKRQKCN